MINKKQEERLDYLLEEFKRTLSGTRIWKLAEIIRRSGELSGP